MKQGRRMDMLLRLRLFLRLILLQASWNSQRMQNLGLLYCLLAWLRRQGADADFRRRFFRRYYGFFNTNPYLAGFLVGGLARLETEGSEGADIPRQLLATYRDSLGRAFASLGDQLFWLGLRPALTLVACLLALMGKPMAVVGVFAVFMLFQLGLRWWSLGYGFGSGMDILGLLDHPFWHKAIWFIKRLALVAAGAVAGVFLGKFQGLGGTGGLSVFGVGIGLGMGMPLVLRRRLPGEVMLLIGMVVCGVLGFAISLTGS